MNVLELWLPIVLSGLAAHVLSTIAWMVSPHHKPEWKKIPGEDDFQKWIDDNNVAADQYVFPYSQDSKEMQSEEFKKKQGVCRGMLILWPRPPNMGMAIGQTLAFFFVAAFFIGYVASIGLERGDTFRDVFRFVTTVGVLTHCFAYFPGVFWFKRRVAMDLVDGVAFALATGLIFAALWPGI